MAKEAKEKTEKVKANCVACAKSNVTREATSRGLCGSHLQSASKMIAANKEAIEAGKKPTHVDKKGNAVTWELLEKKGLAVPAQRRNDVSAIFLS